MAARADASDRRWSEPGTEAFYSNPAKMKTARFPDAGGMGRKSGEGSILAGRH